MNIWQWPFQEIQIITFFFVLIRVTSLMVFLPIYGDRTIPVPVKILFGLAFSFVCFPVLWNRGARVPIALLNSSSELLWAICCDMGFGMMVGFVSKWIFDAVQFAGTFAGTSIGFSIATVLDPHTESQTIALSELQYILAVLLFLAMDGHHIYLSAILQSFKIVPLATADLFANSDSVIQYLIQMSSEVILLGVKLAAPVLVVILLINLTFGILARAVPQMNVLVVSFAANLAVGLLIVIVSLPGFINMVQGNFEAFTPELLKFMQLFRRT